FSYGPTLSVVPGRKPMGSDNHIITIYQIPISVQLTSQRGRGAECAGCVTGWGASMHTQRGCGRGMFTDQASTTSPIAPTARITRARYCSPLCISYTVVNYF